MSVYVGHSFGMDWSQALSSVVSVVIVSSAPIGWVIMSIIKLDRRMTVVETKGLGNDRKLDDITVKVSDVKDDVQLIKVAIAKIETILQSRADESNYPRR